MNAIVDHKAESEPTTAPAGTGAHPPAPPPKGALKRLGQSEKLVRAAGLAAVAYLKLVRATSHITFEPADPIAALLAPNSRVTGVQRALDAFGYGPLKATGVYDVETRAAVERFERARKRPVTGQITDQLVHDLSTLTGRPLE